MSVSVFSRRPRRLLRLQHVSVLVEDGAAVPQVGLDDVSLDVFEGQAHAFLTEGSSVISRVIARLAEAEEGTLTWRGTFFGWRKAPAVAYVPKGARVTRGVLVRDELLSVVACAGAVIEHTDFDALTRALRIDDVLECSTSDVSDDVAYRVLVARSVMLGASVVVLDEPTHGMSPDDAASVLAHLQRLSRAGVTLIVQTRSPEVAAQFPHVFLLIDGALVGSFVDPDVHVLRVEYSAAMGAAEGAVAAEQFASGRAALGDFALEEASGSSRVSLGPDMDEAAAGGVGGSRGAGAVAGADSPERAGGVDFEREHGHALDGGESEPRGGGVDSPASSGATPPEGVSAGDSSAGDSSVGSTSAGSSSVGLAAAGAGRPGGGAVPRWVPTRPSENAPLTPIPDATPERVAPSRPTFPSSLVERPQEIEAARERAHAAADTGTQSTAGEPETVDSSATTEAPAALSETAALGETGVQGDSGVLGEPGVQGDSGVHGGAAVLGEPGALGEPGTLDKASATDQPPAGGQDGEADPQETTESPTGSLVVELDEIPIITTALPIIPRISHETLDADAEKVVEQAKNILKDLPGSVVPTDSDTPDTP